MTKEWQEKSNEIAKEKNLNPISGTFLLLVLPALSLHSYHHLYQVSHPRATREPALFNPSRDPTFIVWLHHIKPIEFIHYFFFSFPPFPVADPKTLRFTLPFVRASML
jgi:hypothetical protein